MTARDVCGEHRGVDPNHGDPPRTLIRRQDVRPLTANSNSADAYRHYGLGDRHNEWYDWHQRRASAVELLVLVGMTRDSASA